MSVLRRSEKIFDHQSIEAKWQSAWLQNKLYNVREDTNLPKWYELTIL